MPAAHSNQSRRKFFCIRLFTSLIPVFSQRAEPKQGCLGWECIFCDEGFEIYANGSAKASAAQIARHCRATWMIWFRTA